MLVRDLMTQDVKAVHRGDSLDAVARALWERDVGCVPVVDGQCRLCGMITDRDICMAAWTTGRRLGELQVSAAMAGRVHAVHADEGLHAAETIMRTRQVRRLPVVDDAGRLIGLVTCNDIVRALAGQQLTASRQMDADHLVQTLAAIGAPRARADDGSRPVPASARI